MGAPGYSPELWHPRHSGRHVCLPQVHHSGLHSRWQAWTCGTCCWTPCRKEDGSYRIPNTSSKICQ